MISAALEYLTGRLVLCRAASAALREYVERFPYLFRKLLKSGPGSGTCTIRFHKHERASVVSIAPLQGGPTMSIAAPVAAAGKALDLFTSHQMLHDFDLVFQNDSNCFEGGAPKRKRRKE